MLLFQPTEAPSWGFHMPTSNKLTQICAWTQQYSDMSAVCKDFIYRDYCWAATARFVLSANLSEGTGLSDLESTQAILLQEHMSRAKQLERQSNWATLCSFLHPLFRHVRKSTPAQPGGPHAHPRHHLPGAPCLDARCDLQCWGVQNR